MRKKRADTIVTNLYRGFVAAGVAAPLLGRRDRAADTFLRTASSVGLTMLGARALKAIIPAPRPDNGKPNSFPSSHTALAVSTAVAAASCDRSRAPLWYAGAALISASRLLLNRHRPVDVAAGALLGYGIARKCLVDRTERRPRDRGGIDSRDRSATENNVAPDETPVRG